MVRTVFSGLSSLTIEDVEDASETIVVHASTREGPVPCPSCGTPTSSVHAFHHRLPADVPVDGRRVLLRVRVRRMRCRSDACTRQTFREQVPGLLERYQRRTVRLTTQLRAIVTELAGRGSARLAPTLGIGVGKNTAIRVLLGIPLPDRPTPAVLGVDDFALRRSRDYATVIIDADSGQRIDVLPGRDGQAVVDWLTEHPGVQVVCRDGSVTYAQAIRDALPTAVQVSDRWHLWHSLTEAAGKEVAAHCSCWAGATRLQEGRRAATTTQRWHQIHDLIERGVGLGDCARRLGLGMKTVKRYAKAAKPERLRRVPQYRDTLVDPYRHHLRRRRAEEPGVPVAVLLAEIRELGYPGSMNLLARYLNQGRADQDRPHLSARQAARLLLTAPRHLTRQQREQRDRVAGACPEMTELRRQITTFSRLLAPSRGNAARLDTWIQDARNAPGLPHMASFARGLELDHAAVTAAVTTKYHNGKAEGANTRTKAIKRQMYGRAGFPLLRHRILLT